MTRFLISDTHFEHENIIEYCDRPFSGVEEMNEFMKSRWETVVSSEDVVLHGGDVVMGRGDVAKQWVGSLPGSVVCVIGNHDDGLNAEKTSFPMVDGVVLERDGFTFYYTHNPVSVPESWGEWVIHGHTHDSDAFIEYDAKRVNVSVECIDYTPIPFPELTGTLRSMNNGSVAGTIHESPLVHREWFQSQKFK